MAFTFHRQPFKTLYITSNVLVVLFVRLPFWTVTNILPAWRPRRSWSLGRTLLIHLFRTILVVFFNTAVPTGPSDAARTAPSSGFAVVEPVPELIVGEILEIAELNHVEPVPSVGYWYDADGHSGESGRKASVGEKVLYHLHGGGYVMSSAHPSGKEMAQLFRLMLKRLPGTSRAFALEYRLSSAAPFTPANPFPAALFDAVAGYNFLVREAKFDPQNIILSGDSAGAHLAFTLARYLHLNNLPGLPIPRGLLLLSPTVDWAVTHVGPHSSMERNVQSDYVAAIFTSGYSKRALLGNLPLDAAETNAWISPASLKLATKGMFSGLPKTCIVAGGAEQTLDPMVTLRDRLQADLGSANVKYVESPDTSHDFFLTPWDEPERDNALREIGKWAEGL